MGAIMMAAVALGFFVAMAASRRNEEAPPQ